MAQLRTLVLVGPSGVGKTSAVRVCAQEAGYRLVGTFCWCTTLLLDSYHRNNTIGETYR